MTENNVKASGLSVNKLGLDSPTEEEIPLPAVTKLELHSPDTSTVSTSSTETLPTVREVTSYSSVPLNSVSSSSQEKQVDSNKEKSLSQTNHPCLTWMSAS